MLFLVLSICTVFNILKVHFRKQAILRWLYWINELRKKQKALAESHSLQSVSLKRDHFSIACNPTNPGIFLLLCDMRIINGVIPTSWLHAQMYLAMSSLQQQQPSSRQLPENYQPTKLITKPTLLKNSTKLLLWQYVELTMLKISK